MNHENSLDFNEIKQGEPLDFNGIGVISGVNSLAQLFQFFEPQVPGQSRSLKGSPKIGKNNQRKIKWLQQLRNKSSGANRLLINPNFLDGCNLKLTGWFYSKPRVISRSRSLESFPKIVYYTSFGNTLKLLYENYVLRKVCNLNITGWFSETKLERLNNKILISKLETPLFLSN